MTIYQQYVHPNGHYASYTKASGMIFTSAQLGIDQNNKESSVGEQLAVCLNKIQRILYESGSDLKKIIKVTIFTIEMENWTEIDKMYASIFGTHKPARGIVGVTSLHLGAKIAVEVIATY